MTVKEYLEKTFNPNDEYERRKRIICNDGFSVSVQGGNQFNYCEPRRHCNMYFEVELGFPSETIPELDKYADDPDNHKETVFGYVPIEEVEELIAKHGGIKEQTQ